MDCSSHQAPLFDGRLTSVQVDALSFNQVVSSQSDVFRTQFAIARGKAHPFYLITQLEDPWHVRQGGHVAHLRPGDAVLVDSAQRYELHFPDAVNVMSIQLPRCWVGQWLTQVHSFEPRVVARDQGWGQALSAMCMQFGHNPALASRYPSALLSDQLGAMLSAAIEPHQHQPTRLGRGLVDEALHLLQQRLDQPGLTADVVATALGVSVRTLHRSFSAGRASFAGTLRKLRLEQAARLLAQTRLAHLTTAEIGRRCGFADASHFVREYQRVHSLTPSRWRKQHINT